MSGTGQSQTSSRFSLLRATLLQSKPSTPRKALVAQDGKVLNIPIHSADAGACGSRVFLSPSSSRFVAPYSVDYDP